MPSQTEQIKDRIDIVALLQEYMELKNAGANYKALCPFHQEKTPSFMVSQSRQIFKCFGCDKGGDIFTFIQEYEGIQFPDALRMLADKAGVRLEKEDYQAKSRESRLYDVLAVAAEFYHNRLLTALDAKVAREYLEHRGIDAITRDMFFLGYSPQEWQSLGAFLQNKGFGNKDARDAGLVISGQYGDYDRFRGRLMFPIWDEQGRVVGFGGRILTEDLNQPKYLNSPQTVLYDKSRILYGLNKAKDAIRREKVAIIVEGYMDVIACCKHGITNAVASSGTALTQNQLQLLKRFTKTVALCFDMDQAGIEAALRSYRIAGDLDLNIKVVRLPKGMDPDDVLKQNPAIFHKAITESANLLDYYFSITLETLDFRRVEDKKQARDKLLPVIAALPDSVERSHYLAKLATLVQVDVDVLVYEARQLGRFPMQKKDIRGNNVLIPRQKNIICDYVEHLIAIMFTYYKFIPSGITLPKLFFKNLDLDALYKEVQDAYNTGKFASLTMELWRNTHTEAVDNAVLLASKDYAELDARAVQTEFFRLADAIHQYVQTKKREKLIYGLRLAEEKNDEKRIAEITKQVDCLNSAPKAAPV